MANKDPLLSLRQAIASETPISLSISAEDKPTENFAAATHLYFPAPQPHAIALDAPTRFISSEKPVDLRSAFFAWQNRHVSIQEYIASAQQLNEELEGSNQLFVERLDLITYLEGASDESDYIQPLEGDSAAARSAAQVASGASGVPAVPSSPATARIGKDVDPRLQEIYNLERRMGDRNSTLRGHKPMLGAA